jgi:type IV pilus assembly protein PilA
MKSQRQAVQQGFTLLELMIVVMIIGVLSAIAIPAFQDYVARTQLTEAMLLADGLKSSVIEAYAAEDNCPSINNNTSGKYVQSVIAAGPAVPSLTGECTITATIKNADVSSNIRNTTITYTLISNTDKLSGSNAWNCTSSALQKYLPSFCVGDSS